MNYADSVTRSFLSYSSPNWKTTSPNKFEDYQDPTYLGFYVRFPDIVNADGTKTVGDAGVYRSLDSLGGGLLFHEDHPDSAIKYLKNIGEYTRAKMVQELIDGLHHLQKMPWYIKTVSGLEEIWKINPEQSFRGKDKKLVFETLESIDLKMTYLIDLYRKASFDAVHMRWMLPQNLRTFKMELVITEIRSMQRPAVISPATNTPGASSDINEYKNPIKPPPFGNINIPGLTEQGIQNAISAVVPNNQWSTSLSSALISNLQRDPGSYSDYPVIMNNFDALATFIKFKFDKCTFEINADAPSYFSGISKIPEKDATNKLTISTPIISESNSYGLLGAILEDTYSQVWRAENAANESFFDPANPPANTIGKANTYLKAVKGNENFTEDQRRIGNQAKLKAEKLRKTTGTGNLLDTAITAGTAAVNAAVGGAISRAVLGNVFRSVFPPVIAENIAKKVSLMAPPLITNVIADVVLESNGSSLSGPIQPAKSELTGATQQNNSVTEVVLTAPVINAASSSKVALTGPAVQPATSTKVNLEGKPNNLVSSGLSSTQLTGPASGPPLASRVTFVEPPKTPVGPGKVNLQEAQLPTATGGTVNLTEPQQNDNISTKVDLTAAELLQTTPGSVDQIAPPVGQAASQKTTLESPAVNNVIEKSVELQAPQVNAASKTVVDLQAPPIKEEGISAVAFEDNGGSTEGTGGRVELTGGAVKESSSETVVFQEPNVNRITTTKVELREPPLSTIDTKKVDLVQPPVLDNKPQPVQLQEPPVTNIRPLRVNFEAPKVSEGELQKVNQEAPPTYEIIPGTVELLEPRTDNVSPGTVMLKEPIIKEEAPGSVSQEAPPATQTELTFVELTGPDVRETGEIGTVPQTSPPTNNTLQGFKNKIEDPNI